MYRRSTRTACTTSDGAPTAVGELLLGPWLAGEVAIVNGFGTGVADDKLVHAYVEEMVRFYLGEEPLLASVPTLDLTREEDLDRLLAAPEEHVVKPRLGQGGAGVVVCATPRPRTSALPGRRSGSARGTSSRSPRHPVDPRDGRGGALVPATWT